ncbi:WG repeat-containing protein [Belliella sp. R4-6]|uniref:WG repeat-containing protein n=1 Tax=Belliella alkalica TaxID=1730871 RepID=A0ABS9VDC5_9BACT|nr:WG repeat-containing protein [Belliella alkalica]MCH7414438.1 WG repeat-containing protein [Belliella alkalica]
MKIIKYFKKIFLICSLLFPIIANSQSWEIYDHKLNLKSRIAYDQINILGESVRVSTANKQLRLLSKDYKPFLDLKGESVYQYLEPWLIVKGPDGLGAFHEYGEEIFTPDYDDIQIFYTRLLAKKGNDFWVYDRMKRSVEMIGTFENAILAKNGQIIAKSEKGYSLPISSNPYKTFGDLREVNENFIISHETTGYGLINREGKYILDPIIDEMTYLDEDYFYAFDGNQYMLIHAREERADIKYTSYHKITLENTMMLEYIHGKLRRVMKKDGILLDMTGIEQVKLVGKEKYNVYSREKKVGLLGINGWEVTPTLNVEKILPGNENLYPSLKSGKFGFIDKQGSWTIQNSFDEVLPFYEGLAAVRSSEKWGYVNVQGQMIIGNEYDAVGRFYKGLAVVQKNGSSHLIDKNGNILNDKSFDRVSLLPDNYYITESNGVFGLINSMGIEVVEPQFDELRKEDHNIILVRKGDKYGVIDENGNYVLPLYYKNILFDNASKLILAEDNYINPDVRIDDNGNKNNKKRRAD